jgi:Rps23 Pro-64 3,4-dihydroxylase Tpa1-like proline 4-hydroxylase
MYVNQVVFFSGVVDHEVRPVEETEKARLALTLWLH